MGQELLYVVLELVPTLLAVASNHPRTDDDPLVKPSTAVETTLPMEKLRHMNRRKVPKFSNRILTTAFFLFFCCCEYEDINCIVTSS